MQLISVIIPIYKVETELRRCVDSVLNQTYHNLDIILVDDGSPDKCGEIADEYSAVDTRIQVIHKQNGGISSARNAGLNVAKGDYILFVDSDDWVEPKMLETMVKAMSTYGTDIVICGIIEETEGKTTIRGMEEDTIFSGKEVVAEIIKDRKIHNYVWNKLFKRACLQGKSFEEGRIFEDILFSYQAASCGEKIVFIKEPLYHYVRRQDSVLGQEKTYLKYELLRARCDQARGVMEIDRQYYMDVVCKTLFSAMVGFKQFALRLPLSKISEYSKKIKVGLSREWKYWSKIFERNERMGLRTFICLSLFFNYPLFYYCLVQIARKIKGKD